MGKIEDVSERYSKSESGNLSNRINIVGTIPILILAFLIIFSYGVYSYLLNTETIPIIKEITNTTSNQTYQMTTYQATPKKNYFLLVVIITIIVTFILISSKSTKERKDYPDDFETRSLFLEQWKINMNELWRRSGMDAYGIPIGMPKIRGIFPQFGPGGEHIYNVINFDIITTSGYPLKYHAFVDYRGNIVGNLNKGYIPKPRLIQLVIPDKYKAIRDFEKEGKMPPFNDD